VSSRARLLALAAAVLVIAAMAVAAFWGAITERFAAPPPAPEKLTVALSSTYIGSGLLFVAQAQGYFAQEGLAVTLQAHTSGRDVLGAALEQRAELGTAGDAPVMFAAMKGAPVSLVATIFTAGHAHGIVARRARGITTVADLKGKSVGLPPGTDAHFLLSVLLAEQALTLRDVTVVPLRPEDSVNALASAKVDAVGAWEPWLGQARQALGDKGVTFLGHRGLLFGFHLAGRKDWVQSHPILVQRLLRALLRAERFVADQPAQAQALIVQASGADPATFGGATEAGKPRYRFAVRLDQSLLTLLESEAQWALQNAVVPARDIPNFLDVISIDALLTVKPDAVSIVR